MTTETISDAEFNSKQTLINAWHAERVADLIAETTRALERGSTADAPEILGSFYERRSRIQADTEAREHLNIRNHIGPCGAQGTEDWGVRIHCPICES